MGSLALTGCAGQSPEPPFSSNVGLPVNLGGGSSTALTPASPPATSGPVALLVPLSGPLQPVGQVLENAAKLGISAGGPALDVRDTGGTPQGAASAAQAALAAGDGLILGPLTSAEAHAVAPLAQAAHVPVLAFTNDASAGAPGIWALGITPAQQVRRVVGAAGAAGRNQIAALLPDSDFGRSLGAALQQQAGNVGGEGPDITFYESGFGPLNQAVQNLSDFADRGEGLMRKIKAAQDLNTAAGRAQARALQHQPIPPPPFNALFIGATQPDELAEIATLLPYYSVGTSQVQLLGPALWERNAAAMGHYGVYLGALYAAPDPAAAASFDARYQAAYGAMPPDIANVAFDAAAVAALLASQGGYGVAALTNPSGFTGTDGVFRLMPDGEVDRGLAVFQITPGGPTIAQPAPASFTGSNS